MPSAEQENTAISGFINKMSKILTDHINDIKQPLQSKPVIESKSMDMVQKVIEIIKPGYLI